MSTASESTPATVDAPPAASQQVPARTAPYVEVLNGKNSFQYVIDSLPHHLRRIAHLEAFLEEAAEIPPEFFQTGRFLPRGGNLLWNMQPNETPFPCRIASSPKKSGAPLRTLNVASSSTGFHSGSRWKTSKISSEKNWRVSPIH